MIQRAGRVRLVLFRGLVEGAAGIGEERVTEEHRAAIEIDSRSIEEDDAVWVLVREGK